MRAALVVLATLLLAGCLTPSVELDPAAVTPFQGGGGSIAQSVDAFGKGEAVADGAFRLARDAEVRIVFALVEECADAPPRESDIRDQTSTRVRATDGEAPYRLRLAYDAGLLGRPLAGVVFAEADGVVYGLPCMGF